MFYAVARVTQYAVSRAHGRFDKTRVYILEKVNLARLSTKSW